MSVKPFRHQMQKRNDLWLVYVVSISPWWGVCVEGDFNLLRRNNSAPSPAKHSLLYRATDGVSSGLNAWLILGSMHKHTYAHERTHYRHDLPEQTGPRAPGSVPTYPGDLQRHTLFTSSISPVRIDWRLDRWRAVCPPVLETQECTAVFIVWLSGLVKRVMIRNDISSAHHTHHLFIWGRKQMDESGKERIFKWAVDGTTFLDTRFIFIKVLHKMYTK